jgi:hypothetical protein
MESFSLSGKAGTGITKKPNGLVFFVAKQKDFPADTLLKHSAFLLYLFSPENEKHTHTYPIDYLEGGKTSPFSLDRGSISARSQSKSAPAFVLHGCSETNFSWFL